MDDSTKDALEGAAAVAVGLAVMGTTGPVGVVALAIAPTIANLTFEKIRGRDLKRARQMYERMIDADEEPQVFADYLNARIMDESSDAFSAFRSLLFASLDAISLAAIEPIALLGRQYLKNECPAWIARGWMRILSELTEPELGGLREVAASCRIVMTWFAGQGASMPVALRISRGARDWPSHLFATQAPESSNPQPLAIGHADRIADLVIRNGLGQLKGQIPKIGTIPESDLLVVSPEVLEPLIGAFPSVVSTAKP